MNDFQRCDENVKLCSKEAIAAIDEVGFGVKDISLASNLLPHTSILAYLNLTTLEGEKMCIEITPNGFGPVGSNYNETEVTIDDSQESRNKIKHYETIYALLSTRSEMFRDKFSQELIKRLDKLEKHESLDLISQN